ncbi:type III-B CRISPR module-associated protein Cmr5 [Spirochaeta dissipatitropha]
MITKSQNYSNIVFQNMQEFISKQESSDSHELLRSYKSLCKRSGGLLRTTGLMQFLIFLQSKANDNEYYKYFLDHLRIESAKINVALGSSDSRQYISIIREMNLPEYMNTTRMTLGLLQWHKRLADVLIQGNAHGDSE